MATLSAPAAARSMGAALLVVVLGIVVPILEPLCLGLAMLGHSARARGLFRLKHQPAAGTAAPCRGSAGAPPAGAGIAASRPRRPPGIATPNPRQPRGLAASMPSTLKLCGPCFTHKSLFAAGIKSSFLFFSLQSHRKSSSPRPRPRMPFSISSPSGSCIKETVLIIINHLLEAASALSCPVASLALALPQLAACFLLSRHRDSLLLPLASLALLRSRYCARFARSARSTSSSLARWIYPLCLLNLRSLVGSTSSACLTSPLAHWIYQLCLLDLPRSLAGSTSLARSTSSRSLAGSTSSACLASPARSLDLPACPLNLLRSLAGSNQFCLLYLPARSDRSARSASSTSQLALLGLPVLLALLLAQLARLGLPAQLAHLPARSDRSACSASSTCAACFAWFIRDSDIFR